MIRPGPHSCPFSATIAETMDTYGHLFPDSEDLGRGAVEDALAAALAEQGRNRSTQ
ncbi:MAG TPA: hypothetical protein VLL69_18950 [Streptosporangiaceae bacterium]|nr:hypothetical protein [Streptosporangiaceae bacterium]